jgi:hypothetical protein
VSMSWDSIEEEVVMIPMRDLEEDVVVVEDVVAFAVVSAEVDEVVASVVADEEEEGIVVGFKVVGIIKVEDAGADIIRIIELNCNQTRRKW